uniref:Uncharacterized protein n=1 Tax=Romanomermis culicivorax TaxID=13658 RepID=A0A915HPG6_ROMCU
MRISTSQKKK